MKKILLPLALIACGMLGAGSLLLFAPGHGVVLAQNNGTSGTFTTAQAATFTAGVSQVFRNVGQAAHYLSYCNTSFTGSIDLEESFDGTTNWVPIAVASYQVGDSSCHVLQAGGYYQNIRAAQTVTTGSQVVFYSASSGPIAFAASGVNSSGPTSPITCNFSSGNALIATGTTVTLVPLMANMVIKVCAYAISFDAATGSGNVTFQTAPNCAAASGALWEILTFTSTPQVVSQGSGLGSLFGGASGGNLCARNTSTANAAIFVSWAYAAP